VAVEGPADVARQHMRFEERGMRIVERHLPDGGRVLDAGCGVGRWFWLTARGRSLVGMDFSAPLLERAAANDHRVDVMLGDVREIPTADASFEAAYTVKVLQCLKEEERSTAVAELFRVTAPGGVVVLFEKTRGADGSVPSDWLRWSLDAGGELVDWYANGFALLGRALAGLVDLRRGFLGDNQPEPDANARGARTSRLARRRPRLYAGYAHLNALALGASLLIEPVAERTLPRAWADHGIFVFAK
jgi:ubiquinone/menaquinone biosynthesis C-methylase UbiE